jgi:hypothetical protein
MSSFIEIYCDEWPNMMRDEECLTLLRGSDDD